MENMVINRGNPRQVSVTVLGANGVKIELSKCTDVELILWINGRSRRANNTQIVNDILVAELTASELDYLGEYSAQVKYTDNGVVSTSERVYLFRVANEFYRTASGTGLSDGGTLEISVSTPQAINKGYSAYEIAVQNGYAGTEPEWVESLSKDSKEAADIAYDAARSALNNSQLAADAADNANTAAASVNAAKDAAIQAAVSANGAADSANTAASTANTAANNANNKADIANTAALNADIAKTNAEKATADANTATLNATNAANNANLKAAYADEQGKFANQQGINAVATANEAATNANNAAFSASQQAAYAKQQGDYAKTEAAGIDAKIATKANQSDLVQLEQNLNVSILEEESLTIEGNYKISNYIEVYTGIIISYTAYIRGASAVIDIYDENKKLVRSIIDTDANADKLVASGYVRIQDGERYFKIKTMNASHPDFKGYFKFYCIYSINNSVNNYENILFSKSVYDKKIISLTESDLYVASGLNNYLTSKFVKKQWYHTVSWKVNSTGIDCIIFYDKDKNILYKTSSTSGSYYNEDAVYVVAITRSLSHSGYIPNLFELKFISDNNISDINESSSYTPQLKCMQKKTYSDGTPDKVLKYIWCDNSIDSYYISDSIKGNRSFIFAWDLALSNNEPSTSYSCQIVDSNAVFVYRTERLSASASEDNRRPPIVYPLNGDTPYVVDFESNVKPSGWLEDVGSVILPNGDWVFCEYTRPSVLKARVWRVASDKSLNDKNNWIITKEFTLSGAGSGFKHCHAVQWDFYANVLYLTTGDDDTAAMIFHSKDNGVTWTQTLNSSEKYCRLLNFVFTEESVYWTTDTSNFSYHFLFKATRNIDGIITQDSITELYQLPNAPVATYTTVYSAINNALIWLERCDGVVNEIPFRGFDLTNNKPIDFGKLYSYNGSNLSLGFRNECVEIYPRLFDFIVGFGETQGAGSYKNYIKVLGNDASDMKKSVNNLIVSLSRQPDNSFIYTFDTVVI